MHAFRNCDIFTPGSLADASRESVSGPLPPLMARELGELRADVVKSPHIALVMDDWLILRPDVTHVVWCHRRLGDVLDFYKGVPPQTLDPDLTGTPPPKWEPQSEADLVTGVYFQKGRGLGAAIERGVPVVALEFPHMVDDAEYLWERLGPVLPPATTREDFMGTFRRTAKKPRG
jgi:hypothetical protein